MADENLIRDIQVTKLSKATYNRWKIEIRDALESHRIWEVASGKSDNTVGSFVAGLKVIVRRIEALESEDFGKSFNEKLMMAKILGCLPKDFNNFVTSWSLLSEDVSLESFLEKLTNAERNITERLDDISHEAFKAQSKSTNSQDKKAVNKKFQGKCHKCDSGASVHLTRNMEWFSSLRKLASPLVLNAASGQTLLATHVDAERETRRKAISLRTDNGTEYINQNVKEVLKSMGIIHELSPPNVKQYLSKMDHHLLWTEAVGTAAYLRNRVPNRGFTNTTPYYEWYGKKPDVSHLRVFGAKAFVRIPDSQ
ncbi:uncharacterized protein LOC112639817 [Camponotus floridanus]|uniref:uncharacterized protein LOC112639817 n=1 Tax=Camponotus floridanus TaxID=104421 RepID=UPI000DC6C419|nr:uncharacterized protein LOC112639817 [Camponotus floridanus]